MVEITLFKRNVSVSLITVTFSHFLSITYWQKQLYRIGNTDEEPKLMMTNEGKMRSVLVITMTLSKGILIRQSSCVRSCPPHFEKLCARRREPQPILGKVMQQHVKFRDSLFFCLVPNPVCPVPNFFASSRSRLSRPEKYSGQSRLSRGTGQTRLFGIRDCPTGH